MSEIVFMVDENQWLDAVVRDASGKRRSLQTGDFIEAQLHVNISMTLAWGPVRPDSGIGKKIVRISDDGLHYFSGMVLKALSRPTGDKRARGKLLWEVLLDCNVPIICVGLFPEGENPFDPSVKSLEGLGFLWGSISFHTGELSKTITGKITNIRELPPAPLSTGFVTLHLITLDTSEVGPLGLKLLVPPK